MPLSVQLVTGPAAEPVKVLTAKNQCRVDFPDDDALFALYITAARQYVEKVTQRAIFNQHWVRTLDHFPIWWSENGTVNPNYRNDWPYYSAYWNQVTIDVPFPRTVSVDSITYVGSDGTEYTLDTSQYAVDLTSEPARIVPAQGCSWPSISTYLPGSVAVAFTAGSYGDGVETNTCPETIVMAILLLVEHWYNNRGASGDPLKSIPFGVDALLDTEKVQALYYRP